LIRSALTASQDPIYDMPVTAIKFASHSDAIEDQPSNEDP
jgi:hypothetical protein